MGSAEWFFALGLMVYAAGAVAGLGTWKNPAAARQSAFGLALLGSLLHLIASITAMSHVQAAAWNLPSVFSHLVGVSGGTRSLTPFRSVRT